MKSLTLEVDYDFDFTLIGIVSSCKEYKLAWSLNQFAKLRLTKQQDLIYDFMKKGRLVISNYLHQTEYSTFRLFKNRSVTPCELKKPYLLHEIKDFDYVIRVDGQHCSVTLLNQLKSLTEVQYVKQFEPGEFQYKENLLL
jgi:hypothetical protein